MKYVVIIADGGADFPIEQLGGQTPFEAARTPHVDALARAGRIGRAATTPPGWAAGSDVCSMCLLGYDPTVYHTGRAPLEAAALGLELGERDCIFRVNLVTVGEPGTSDGGLMLDHSAGAISNAEARPLVEGLMEHWRLHEPALAADLRLTPGVSYRNILVDVSGNRPGGGARDYGALVTVPPHEIPRRPWIEHIPTARAGSGEPAHLAADILRRLMELARVYLPTHPINAARIAAGKRPANMAWIWGQGGRPRMPSFQEKYGLRGAMTTAVDLLAGIATLIGWDRLDVPGVTSYHDNNYAGQGRATCEALDEYDIVCCHVESPDECAHQGDWKTKTEAMVSIDTHIVGPVVERLRGFGDPEKERGAVGWRLLYLPDHYTLVSTRKHDATPVPFLMAGAWVRSAVERPYSEKAALESDLSVDPGHELMEYFLRGGLR
ncbi:MAG TPA: 2,3-bisphosphoglycerate-independent phosphoglycerate mutase [Phycisphaerales bacterium]|nr:2,3-bisphosphoglycerate-independent phosphoglycerate mutase [Phycisphaerales bacterium]